MAENAPGFEGGTERGVLPKAKSPLRSVLIRNGLVSTTVGAAPGANTSVNKSRRKHPTNVNEEIGAVESESLINRASDATDVSHLKAKFTKKKPSFAYAKDLSGNGGPAYTRT